MVLKGHFKEDNEVFFGYLYEVASSRRVKNMKGLL